MENYYIDALKKGKKNYKLRNAKNMNPFLPSLDEIIDSGDIAGEVELNVIDIPAEYIIGTKTQDRSFVFAGNYMPLAPENSEFAAKWKSLCESHLNEGINEPVRAYEYLNRYYILEGNKRVSVLKYFEAPLISGDVTRILPKRTGDPCIELYYEFIDFFNKTKINAIEFSRQGSYDELITSMGWDGQIAITDYDRKKLLSDFFYFQETFQKMKGEELKITAGDAFLKYLKHFGLQRLEESSEKKLQHDLLKLWENFDDTSSGSLKENSEHGKIKILAVSDIETEQYYDNYRSGCLDEFDLIISCGDLKKEYLEFLATMANCPVLYIYGNHDDSFENDPPLGCIDIDGKIFEFCGLNILGLGGSMRYRQDVKHMYNESDMKRRIAKLELQLYMKKGVDILVTHAPALGYGDLDDVAHKGFACFNDLIIKYHPLYHFHGHIHRSYDPLMKKEFTAEGTKIINAFKNAVVEINI